MATDPDPAPVPDIRHTIGDLVVESHKLARVAARSTGSTESPAIWRTISVLQSEGPMRVGELALSSRVAQPTMTKIVTKLVEIGWLTRVADTADARAWQIAATPNGIAALEDWRDELSRAMLPMFADLTPQEAATLRHAVLIIRARVRPASAADERPDASRIGL